MPTKQRHGIIQLLLVSFIQDKSEKVKFLVVMLLVNTQKPA